MDLFSVFTTCQTWERPSSPRTGAQVAGNGQDGASGPGQPSHPLTLTPHPHPTRLSHSLSVKKTCAVFVVKAGSSGICDQGLYRLGQVITSRLGLVPLDRPTPDPTSQPLPAPQTYRHACRGTHACAHTHHYRHSLRGLRG